MWQLYLLEARYELVKLSRLPAYAVPTIGFPVMFYLLFGVAMSGTRVTGGRDISSYLLATYGAFGLIGAGLFALGVGVAVERAQGWLLVKRASPMGDPLTDRERQVLRLAGDGRSGPDIASELSLSEGTVRNYLSEAINKVGGRNRIDAARIARAKGWL